MLATDIEETIGNNLRVGDDSGGPAVASTGCEWSVLVIIVVIVKLKGGLKIGFGSDSG